MLDGIGEYNVAWRFATLKLYKAFGQWLWQLVERSIPTPEIHSLNPDIDKILWTNCKMEKTKIKKKRPWMGIFKKLYKDFRSKEKRPTDTMNCFTSGNLKNNLNLISYFWVCTEIFTNFKREKIYSARSFRRKNPFLWEKNPFLWDAIFCQTSFVRRQVIKPSPRQDENMS